MGGAYVTDSPTEEMHSARSSATREGDVEGAKRTVAWGAAHGPASRRGSRLPRTAGEDGNPGQGGEGLPDLLTEMGQGCAGFA